LQGASRLDPAFGPKQFTSKWEWKIKQ
jgi:hypothetical protein